jgi:predicted Fe-S protein YdhL (DUF1289 family)
LGVVLVKQIEFFEIKNPCVGICENGPRGFCRGCFRSREERQHWNVLEQDVKRQIIKACAQRERRAKLKRSGDSQEDDSSPQSNLF